MPKIPGDDSTKPGRKWNETYEPHEITIRGLDATLRASTGSKGLNGAAVESRINYLRRAMNIGLVRESCMRRAQWTLANLESQLI